VPITDMPQMVAMFNGMGGGSAAAIGAVELLNAGHRRLRRAGGAQLPRPHLVLAVIGALIGAVSLRLRHRLGQARRAHGQALHLPRPAVRQRVLPRAARRRVAGDSPATLAMPWIVAFFVLALLVGVLMTLPIGGADMPVVISLYNAFTGLAVAFEGYVLGNEALIIAGTVVGAAGMLLTQLMAKAMNRPISNVLFSNFGGGGRRRGDRRAMKPIEAADAAAMMATPRRVVIVPGYGMAVAQAQHKIWELTSN
jgi:NAD(P) transhydrogenase subunit beta